MTLLGQFLANKTFFQKLISTIFLVLQLPTFIHIFQNIDQAVIELSVQTEQTDGWTNEGEFLGPFYLTTEDQQ